MTLAKLKAIVGAGGFIENPQDMAAYTTPWRGAKAGHSPLALFPQSTQQVVEIVKICAAARLPLVPQGGNTGLAGGASVHGEILVNLSHMNRIRVVDTLGYTITTEAGCILARLQAEAKKHHRLFPLSMGSEGSCQIGGNIATNAGGTNVLHYGNTRDLVLGIEAVLPDGSLFQGVKSLRKDNAGYDLKQLFIGSEGTLGIITAATLKLFPLPAQVETAFLAIPDAQAALELLALFREHSGDRITAFEYISEPALALVVAHLPGARRPLDTAAPAYLLVELSTAEESDTLRTLTEHLLTRGMERGWITDGALATSLAQAKEFWHLRESISEAARHAGHGIHFDISVPITRIPDFLSACDPAVLQAAPQATLVTFGHLGDGNLHYNMTLPQSDISLEKNTIKTIVYSKLLQLNGSITAEHGIGTLRRDDLVHIKPAADLTLMRTLKRALDPLGILNPGKVL